MKTARPVAGGYCRNSACHVFNSIIPDVYFLLDHLFALNTGFYQRDMLTTDRKKIWERYVSWEHFRTGDRGNIYVLVMEFIPFYLCVALGYFYDFPFWVLSLCALPRGRRVHDLLVYFYSQEVSGYVDNPNSGTID